MDLRCKTLWTLIVSLVLAAGTWSLSLRSVKADASSSDRNHSETTTSRPSNVVDDQLVRKLLGGQSSATDTVKETLDHMERATKQLTERLDPGPETQKIQTEILKGLDRLIEEAGKSRNAPTKRRRIRRKAQRPADSQRQTKRQKQAGDGQAASAPEGSLGAKDTQKSSRKKDRLGRADLARRWGFLPERDRDEFTQGIEEQFMPKFREQILHYYRSLAEESQKNEQDQP